MNGYMHLKDDSLEMYFLSIGLEDEREDVRSSLLQPI